MNTVVIHGNLARDIEMAGAEKTIAKTVIATNDRKKEAHFFDLVMFGKTAEIAQKHLSKGKEIVATGRLSQEKWEKNGEKRSRVVIIVDSFDFCGSASSEPKEESSEEVPF